MVAEGGKVDARLTGDRQNGPAIFTTDFPVMHGEIDQAPPSTCKNNMNLSSYQLLCIYRILSKYGILCIFFFRKPARGFHALLYSWRRATQGIMARSRMVHRMTQRQFYAGVAPVKVFCRYKPSKGLPRAGER
jgi:hypothetical protein